VLIAPGHLCLPWHVCASIRPARDKRRYIEGCHYRLFAVYRTFDNDNDRMAASPGRPARRFSVSRGKFFTRRVAIIDKADRDGQRGAGGRVSRVAYTGTRSVGCKERRKARRWNAAAEVIEKLNGAWRMN